MKKRIWCLPLIATMLSGCNILGFELPDLGLPELSIPSFLDPLGWFSKEEPKTEGTVWTIKVNPTGGTAQEQEAIRAACNHSIALKSPSSTIVPTSTPLLEEDKGDFIKLEKSKVERVEKTPYTVSLEWEVDETQSYFKSFVSNEGNTNMLYINYKGWEHKSETGEIKFRLKKATCGGATLSYPEALQYKCNIQNQQKYVDNLTIAQINKVNGSKTVTAGTSTYTFESTFDMVDYEFHTGEKYSPYFKIHENNADVEGAYYYCNVPGKVIYTAPDGNWALIADGNQILEVYAGSGTPLTATNFPYLQVGKYVVVTGNLAQYCGNIQLGFVTSITELTDHSAIAEPAGTTFATMTEQKISGLKSTVDSQYDKSAIDGFSNSLGQVTGTVVANSLKDKDGNSVSSASSLANNRFTFDVQVGSQTLKVAYDYHTDKDGSVGLFNALKSKLSTSGTTITVKGTMRYSGNNSSPFLEPKGVWTIVPYLPSQVA